MKSFCRFFRVLLVIRCRVRGVGVEMREMVISVVDLRNLGFFLE